MVNSARVGWESSGAAWAVWQLESCLPGKRSCMNIPPLGSSVSCAPNASQSSSHCSDRTIKNHWLGEQIQDCIFFSHSFTRKISQFLCHLICKIGCIRANLPRSLLVLFSISLCCPQVQIKLPAGGLPGAFDPFIPRGGLGKSPIQGSEGSFEPVTLLVPDANILLLHVLLDSGNASPSQNGLCVTWIGHLISSCLWHSRRMGQLLYFARAGYFCFALFFLPL